VVHPPPEEFDNENAKEGRETLTVPTGVKKGRNGVLYSRGITTFKAEIQGE